MAQPPTRPSPSNAITLKSSRNRFSPPRLFAWGLCTYAILVVIWSIASNLPAATSAVTPAQWLSQFLFIFFMLALAVVAALIISRQPGNPIGWLMALAVFGITLIFFDEAYLQTVTQPAPAPSLPLLLSLWLDNSAWTLFIFPLLLIPLIFPTGRLPSKRWRWFVIYALVFWGFYYFVTTFAQQWAPSTPTGWTVRNPIGFISPQATAAIFGLPWVIGLAVLAFAPLVSLLLRYRRGSVVEKAQIKWVVYASAFFGVSYILLLALSSIPSQFITDLVSVLLPISLLALPASIGIAILHYRLWDIDFVINRSLVYAALTVALLALFGLSLLIIQSLFQNLPGGPLIALVIAAAVFGAFFQPARRWLQRFVDRRLYNIQIDYNKTPAPVVSTPTGVFKHTHFGDYQNLELIGQGGMAEVYKSIHPTLGLPVAIKVLQPSLSPDPDFQRRFTREAQTVSRLQHPHIIRLYDHGELNSQPYMVMEYISGPDLGQHLADHGRLTLSEAEPILKETAAALDYAHSQGLVHRDIKPSNILLDKAASSSRPRAVLSDFGIAKILNGVTRYTATGAMIGTMDYIAPEQIQGAPDVDSRADVYAFGVMVFQLLTGVLPFQHQNPGALLMAHMLQPPPDPRDLAPHLSPQSAQAVQRAMAKNPHDRFSTVGEFINALFKTNDPTLGLNL